MHRQKLMYRHIAWLTALRFALREGQPWEVALQHRTNREWETRIHIPEREDSLDDELAKLLGPDELKTVLSRTNKPAAILTLQF